MKLEMKAEFASLRSEGCPKFGLRRELAEVGGCKAETSIPGNLRRDLISRPLVVTRNIDRKIRVDVSMPLGEIPGEWGKLLKFSL